MRLQTHCTQNSVQYDFIYFLIAVRRIPIIQDRSRDFKKGKHLAGGRLGHPCASWSLT